MINYIEFSPPFYIFTEEIMAKPYSLDLRERVLKDCDSGMSSEDVARKYSVSIAWVYSLRTQRRETGSIAPKECQRSPRFKLVPYETEVRQAVADHPDATLVELCELLSKHVLVSTTSLCDFLKHLKITRKKRPFVPQNNTAKMLLKNVKSGKHSKRSSM
jgi:putative transposase